MKRLSNKELLIAYCDAHKLSLEDDFIEILTSEMIRRNIALPKKDSPCYEQVSHLFLKDLN
ncbi:MAG: sporulation histidine kinase inhibitor Sda [Anaerobacillus sp.]